MTYTIRTAVLAAVLVSASSASAQTRQTVTVSPADAARWDVAMHIGWRGGNKSETGPDWDGWYDTASFDASAGYYWSRNLKVEFDIATTAEGGMYIPERVALPGETFPYYRSREHRFSTSSVAGGLTYQFFENAWFHPFVGGGLAVIRETERAGVTQPGVFYRDAQTRVSLPPPPPIDSVSTNLRPFAALGFKVYLSRRVFIRTDVRLTASREHVESAAWRGGVGVDF